MSEPNLTAPTELELRQVSITEIINHAGINPFRIEVVWYPRKWRNSQQGIAIILQSGTVVAYSILEASVHI